MSTPLHIKTTGNQKEIIIATAEKFGSSVCEEYKISDEYEYLICPGFFNTVAGTGDPQSRGSKEATFEEIMAHITGIANQLTVKLNNDYTAEITKEGVKVGCQTFTHEVIEQLYHASKSAIK